MSGVRHHALQARPYQFGSGQQSDTRPLVAIDVDGVIALDPGATVARTRHVVAAWGKWRREIEVADGTAQALRALASRCEVAWASAWSYTAHEALRPVLELPEDPWHFLPCQFDAATIVAQYAAGRAWAWVTADAASSGQEAEADGGIVAVVDDRRGLPSLDLDELLRRLGAAT